ncbi:Transposase [Popillia japonica]|uniref:Transposase n=1 Tax=Popillia japonica TaxID=7064 RepID=A0AAW1N0I2_POPJA
MKQSEIAKSYQIKRSIVSRIIKRYKDTRVVLKLLLQQYASDLSMHSLFSKRPAKKPLLSKKNRRNRLQFARDHLQFDMGKRVVFSNESKVMVHTMYDVHAVQNCIKNMFALRLSSKVVPSSCGHVSLGTEWALYTGLLVQ